MQKLLADDILNEIKRRKDEANRILKLREDFWGTPRFNSFHKGEWAKETRFEAQLWNTIWELVKDAYKETN